MKKFLLLLCVSVIFIVGCSKSNSTPPNNNDDDTTTTPPPDTTIISHSTFAKGADISWLTQMEASGYKFYNRDGVEEDCYQVMKDERHEFDSVACMGFIVHISNGYDNNLFRWMFDGLKNNNAKWDIIGMSLYPSSTNWSTLDAQCLANMNDMISRYKKPVMICEVGMSWTDSAVCKSFLTDIISKTKSVTNGNGLGVFYWEPESYNNWQGYSLGTFDNSGKPTVALDAFKN